MLFEVAPNNLPSVGWSLTLRAGEPTDIFGRQVIGQRDGAGEVRLRSEANTGRVLLYLPDVRSEPFVMTDGWLPPTGEPGRTRVKALLGADTLSVSVDVGSGAADRRTVELPLPEWFRS